MIDAVRDSLDISAFMVYLNYHHCTGKMIRLPKKFLVKKFSIFYVKDIRKILVNQTSRHLLAQIQQQKHQNNV